MSAPLYYFAGDFENYRGLFLEQNYHILSYKAGDVIFESHTNWDCSMYINSGSVTLSIVQNDREKLLAYYGEGYIIPYNIPSEIEVTHLLQYKAVTDVTVIKIKKNIFDSLINKDFDLFKALYASSWKLVHLLTHEIESQTFDTGLEKVSTFLYTYFENTGHLRFEITTKDLQAFVGLNRTNLSKYLSFLTNEHIIEKESGLIKITAPEKLKNYCSQRVIECNIVPSKMIAHSSVAEDSKWSAIVNRDESYDGVFWYGVVSTGIYCIPSCSSMTPLRKNVIYFDTPEEAEDAGYRSCKRCNSDNFTYNPNREFLKEVKLFIDENYFNPDKIDSYFQSLPMNRNYANKLFKIQYDISPNAYIKEKQLEKVTTLLCESDMSVLDIAMTSGFNSMSNFYNTFKSNYGMTPAQYRKKEYVEGM